MQRYLTARAPDEQSESLYSFVTWKCPLVEMAHFKIIRAFLVAARLPEQILI